MANARNMLQLRVRHAATPARVARVATMFDDALRALGASEDIGTTLVVENRNLVATVRTRSKDGAAAVGALIKIVQNPTAPLPLPGRAELARALARYAREEARYHPQLWLPRRVEPLCNLDEAFAGVMDAVAAATELAAEPAPVAASHKAHGTTYVYSKILRVGRLEERHGIRVRVVIDGRHHELSLGQLDAGPFYDAAKRGVIVRLKLQSEWTQTPGKPLSLTTAEIVGMEETPLASGARILALAEQYSVITADELPVVLASIEKARSGE